MIIYSKYTKRDVSAIINTEVLFAESETHLVNGECTKGVLKSFELGVGFIDENNKSYSLIGVVKE